MAADWSSWMITAGDRATHDKQFILLNPVNGFLGKEQLKAFFLKSGLPPFVLGKIWALSDMTVDGKMDRKEFSIAMFLIQKRLEGMSLPDILPVGLIAEPQPTTLAAVPLSTIPNFRMQTVTVSNVIPTHSATYSNSLNRVMSTPVVSTTNRLPEIVGRPGAFYGMQSQQVQEPTWVLPDSLRSTYEELFRTHDRFNRGYVTGLEAKSIFKPIGLSQTTLAHIWSLSDLDKDGNLNCAEFCIASYLIGLAVNGFRLPTTLPASLLPSQRSDSTDSTRSVNPDDGNTSTLSSDPSQSVTTFEDKRRANFLQGQVELERRRQQLADRMQQEKEARIEKEREDMESAEKDRVDKQRKLAEKAQRQVELLHEVQLQRETRRRQAEGARQNARRTAEIQLQLDSEHQRVGRLLTERNQCETRRQQAMAHKACLMEAASDQQLRNKELRTRISRSQTNIDMTKSEINEKRIKRDNYERELRDLTEQIEAAKAELSRWQREGQQLALKVAMGEDTNPTGEQCKTLQANCELRSTSIRQLSEQLTKLDLRLTQQGEELACWRNKEHDVTRRNIKLQSELAELRRSVTDIRNKTGKVSAFASDSVPSARLGNSGGAPPAGTTPYEVMFDFVARHPDELSLKTGSLVYVYNEPPVVLVSGWLYGQLAAGSGTGKQDWQKGLFPETYVRKQVVGTIDPFDPFGVHKPIVSRTEPAGGSGADAPPVVPVTEAKSCTSITPFYCRALYAYESSVSGDLNLAVGDIVRVHTIRDEWWEGTCERTNFSGLFPANYTQRLDTQDAYSPLRQLSDAQFSPSTTSALSLLSNRSCDLNTLIGQGDCQPSTSVAENPAPFTSARQPELANTPATFSPGTPSARGLVASVSTSEVINAKPELARAIAPFAGTSAGQLSLQPGQVVLVRKRSSKGWWEGELQQRGRVRQFGWFPADYVRLISPSSSHSSASYTKTSQLSASSRIANGKSAAATRRGGFGLPDRTIDEVASGGNEGGGSSSVKSVKNAMVNKNETTPTLTTSPSGTAPRVDMMQALFAYKAAHADELSFEEGDIITLLSRDEPEWWRGRLQAGGAEGLFPVNYVKPYHANSQVDQVVGKLPTELNNAIATAAAPSDITCLAASFDTSKKCCSPTH